MYEFPLGKWTPEAELGARLGTMRELAAAALLLLALVVGALAPKFWPADGASALASGAPSASGGPLATLASTPTPAPKPTAPRPSTFPITDRPLELALPASCQILRQGRHADDFGATWTVQCGSAKANLEVATVAVRQGWSHMEGPPIGVGIQVYAKGTLSMQLAYRLDGPGFADSFQLVQYSRPFAQGGGASRPNVNAYLRVPTGFDLPTGCVWGEAPAGFTDEGAYRMPFVCPAIKSDEIQATFTRALESQGWHVDNGAFGSLTYAKDDLRVTAMFTSGKATPSDVPSVVEYLCCYGQ